MIPFKKLKENQIIYSLDFIQLSEGQSYTVPKVYKISKIEEINLGIRARSCKVYFECGNYNTYAISVYGDIDNLYKSKKDMLDYFSKTELTYDDNKKNFF